MSRHLPAGWSALALCLASWMSLAALPAHADSAPLAYPEGATLQKEVFRLGRLELILAEHAWLAARHRPASQRTVEPPTNDVLISTLGRPHDRERAAQSLVDAAAAGNTTARVQRAALVLAGLADDHGADAEALATLVAATRSGDPLAATLLGQALVEGRALDRDLAEARHLWQQAAERGQVQAQWLLGRALIAGLGGPALTPNPAQRRVWLERAAAAGRAAACASLAYWWAARDEPDAAPRARAWALAGAARGDLQSEELAGAYLLSGFGGPSDQDAALPHLLSAANRGSP